VVSRLAWSSLFSAATLLAAFVIAWILSGRIVRPLRQIGKDASVLARGDLTHRTMIRTDDEVGILAGTFNRMAASLERRDEEARRAAIEVRQAKDTLAAVIDASPVAIICSDVNRCIVMWNRAASRFSGTLPWRRSAGPPSSCPRAERQSRRHCSSARSAARRCATCMLSASARTIPWST